jgi:hypothetical protein
MMVKIGGITVDMKRRSIPGGLYDSYITFNPSCAIGELREPTVSDIEYEIALYEHEVGNADYINRLREIINTMMCEW